ncbi:hypothetical protein LPJ66_011396, partial [Kickxella alabastrina]
MYAQKVNADTHGSVSPELGSVAMDIDVSDTPAVSSNEKGTAAAIGATTKTAPANNSENVQVPHSKPVDIQAAQTVLAAPVRMKTESTPFPFPVLAPATDPVTAPIRVKIETTPVLTPVAALLLSPLQGKKPVEKKPEAQSTTVSKPTPPPMSNMMPVSLIKQTVVAAPPQAQVPILPTRPSAKPQSPLPTLAPNMFTLKTSSSSLNAQIPQVVSAPKTQIPQVVSSYKVPVKAPATVSATASAKTKANRPPAVPPMPPIDAMASKAKVASASVSSAGSTVGSESRSRSRSVSRLRSTSRRRDVENRLGQLEVTIKGATKHAREDDSSSGRSTKRQQRSPRISGAAFFGNSNGASDDDDDELIKRYSDPDDVEFGIVGASGLSR